MTKTLAGAVLIATGMTLSPAASSAAVPAPVAFVVLPTTGAAFVPEPVVMQQGTRLFFVNLKVNGLASYTHFGNPQEFDTGLCPPGVWPVSGAEHLHVGSYIARDTNGQAVGTLIVEPPAP